MTKKELSELVKKEMNIPTNNIAEATVNAVFDIIKTKLSEGETVEIFGFGKFETVERSERMGRNPKTGEEIKIEAKKAVKFKASKSLSEAVR